MNILYFLSAVVCGAVCSVLVWEASFWAINKVVTSQSRNWRK